MAADGTYPCVPRGGGRAGVQPRPFHPGICGAPDALRPELQAMREVLPHGSEALPHEAIRATEDRSWTGRLVEALSANASQVGAWPTATNTEELGEIGWTLEVLADPRSLGPLARVLEDRDAAPEARERAGAVLRAAVAPQERARQRVFLFSDDPVLQRHALASMDSADAEVMAKIASDDAHPLLAEAISSLCWGFQAPRFQAMKARALGHARSDVRRAACDSLLWDEPVIAEEGLLRATGDAEEGVAIAAVNTLRYYSTRSTLRALAELRSSPRPGVQKMAEESFGEVESAFLSALERGGVLEVPYLRTFMGPIWGLLSRPDDSLLQLDGASAPDPDRVDDDVAAVSAVEVAPPCPSASAIEAEYGELDGPWFEKKERFRRVAWESYGALDRARLASFFATHQDPWVREAACTPLATWNARELLDLLEDKSFLVKKSAMYALGKTPPSQRIAGKAWAHLHAPGIESTHAYETLETYVHHASRGESVPQLVELVRSDTREAVTTQAVHALTKLDAGSELKSLLPLLTREPQVTWSTHIALLEGALAFDLLPPEARAMTGVDDVWLQGALAAVLTRG